MKQNRLIKTAPFIVSAGLVYLLFRKINIQEFAIVLHQFSAPNIMIALMLDIPFVLLKSYKWYRIAKMAVSEIKYSEAVISFLMGLGASLFTPAQLGELARTVTFNENRRKILFLTFIDKLTDLIALMLLFAISLSFAHWDIGTILKSVGWFPVINILVWQKQGFKTRFIVSQFLLSVACFVPLMIQFYVILLNFVDIRLQDVAIGLPLITVAGMLPVTISGLGLREIVATVVLPRFGMGKTQAVAASLLFFFINGLILGLLGLILLSFRQGKAGFSGTLHQIKIIEK